MKQNCWEFKKCGREPGGVKETELGICPCATETRVNSLNNGKNAGRVCWAVSGSLCGGKVQGSFATKIKNCMACDFYKQVRTEEGKTCVDAKSILEKLRAA